LPVRIILDYSANKEKTNIGKLNYVVFGTVTELIRYFLLTHTKKKEKGKSL
jgi:hypothetical protein